MKLYRLLAFLIDHIIFSLVFLIVFFSLTWESFFYPNELNASEPFEIFYPTLIVALIVFYMKDLFGGRSFGKRFFRLAVRDANNLNNTPTKSRLFIRNITLLIWPLEFIYYLINNKRIGDLIAKTQVIRIGQN